MHFVKLVTVCPIPVLLILSAQLISCNTKTIVQEYVCICPSIRRPICGYTPSGTITQFDNLCSLKCEAARNKDFKFGILTPNLCQKGLHTYLEEKGPEVYLKEWTAYIKEEINFWKPLEQILDTLLLV